MASDQLDASDEPIDSGPGELPGDTDARHLDDHWMIYQPGNPVAWIAIRNPREVSR